MIDASFSNGSELLAFVGVVGVEVVVGAEPVALGRLWLVPVVLRVWFYCEYGCSFTLHVLGLGFLLFWVSSWKLEDG